VDKADFLIVAFDLADGLCTIAATYNPDHTSSGDQADNAGPTEFIAVLPKWHQIKKTERVSQVIGTADTPPSARE
jgi:hypothetical protein